jgi:hypothetical protein
MGQLLDLLAVHAFSEKSHAQITTPPSLLCQNPQKYVLPFCIGLKPPNTCQFQATGFVRPGQRPVIINRHWIPNDLGLRNRSRDLLFRETPIVI